MHRSLPLLCLFAALAAPLLCQAEAADDLAARWPSSSPPASSSRPPPTAAPAFARRQSRPRPIPASASMRPPRRPRASSSSRSCGRPRPAGRTARARRASPPGHPTRPRGARPVSRSSGSERILNFKFEISNSPFRNQDRRPSHEPHSSRRPRAGLHADRIAGGDRDHRRVGRPAPARGPDGPRGGATGPVHEQPEADRPGDAQLPRVGQRLPAGLPERGPDHHLHHRGGQRLGLGHAGPGLPGAAAAVCVGQLRPPDPRAGVADGPHGHPLGLPLPESRPAPGR